MEHAVGCNDSTASSSDEQERNEQLETMKPPPSKLPPQDHEQLEMKEFVISTSFPRSKLGPSKPNSSSRNTIRRNKSHRASRMWSTQFPIKLPPSHSNNANTLTIAEIREKVQARKNDNINNNDYNDYNDNHSPLRRNIKPGARGQTGQRESINSSNSTEISSATFLSQIFPSFMISRFSRRIIENVRNTRLYRFVWYSLLFVLLFGDEIQDLRFGASTDVYWDVLYCVTLVLLLVDIVLVSFTSNQYFLWRHDPPTALNGETMRDRSAAGSLLYPALFSPSSVNAIYRGGDDSEFPINPPIANNYSKRSKRHATTQSSSASNLRDGRSTRAAPASRTTITNHTITSTAKKPFLQQRIGTITFWFDLISTLSLVVDISFITIGPQFSSRQTFAYPCLEYHRGSPIKPSYYLFIAIIRTLRIISLLQVKTVVNAWSRFNTYLNILIELRRERAEKRRIRMHINKMTDLGVMPFLVLRNILGRGNEIENEMSQRRYSIMDEEVAATKIQKAFREAWGLLQPTMTSIRSSENLIALMNDTKNKNESESESVSSHISKGLPASMSSKEVAPKIKEGKLKLAAEVRRKFEGRRINNGGVLSGSKQKLLGKSNNKKPKRRRFMDVPRISFKNEMNRSNHTFGNSNRAITNSELKRKSMLGKSLMRITGNRVGLGIILTLIFTVLFTYYEFDASMSQTMITLHNIELGSTGNTTKDPIYVARALNVILLESENLHSYTSTYGVNYTNNNYLPDYSQLRDRERSEIKICTPCSTGNYNCTGCHCSTGKFNNRPKKRQAALASLILTIFIIVVWWTAVMFYSVPVSGLLVIPIQRMVMFLDMLVKDPLGYQKTSEYHQFVSDEEGMLIRTGWSKEHMDGMETSFLMSTLTRISNLMNVGFGSAGVDIIRSNLRRKQDVHFQNLVGTTVSCIFVFGDIRQFTDVSECLQEEIFGFTNRIASVVHSFCNSYGGSANKNIGDAFLVSWRLDVDDDHNSDDDNDDDNDDDGYDYDESSRPGIVRSMSKLISKKNQADRALLAVVRIFIALQDDDFYLEDMSAGAKRRLVEKMADRPGSLVQMGFGLHAGKAIQGAIGSERKLDATYISKAVDLSEYLESTTKKYGVKLLMSGEFHTLLAKGNQNRCRQIDRIMLFEHDDYEDSLKNARDCVGAVCDHIELYTFDMVVEDMWDSSIRSKRKSDCGKGCNSSKSKDCNQRRRTMLESEFKTNEANPDSGNNNGINQPPGCQSKIDLPSGPTHYSADVWLKGPMRNIRRQYTDNRFRCGFKTALKAYFAGDWQRAAINFRKVDVLFDDNPSKFFLKKMKKTNNIPPSNFDGYGSA